MNEKSVEQGKIEEAIKYWKDNLHASCEAGSPRDHLAIYDIGLFMKALLSEREKVKRLESVIRKAYELNQNMHCYKTTGNLNLQLEVQTRLLRDYLAPATEEGKA